MLPRLAPSPAVSRAVMAAVRADTPAWGWLRRSLQALSSPGMAVASGLALVVALAGALIITLSAPGRGGNQAIEPESTIAAVAIAPLPTEAPTEIPTAKPEPTATRAALRTVAPAPAKEVAKTPTPRPTATRVAIAAAAEPTAEAVIAPVTVEQPIIEPVTDDPTLAMAEEPVDTGASAELAQAVEPAASDEGAPEADAVPEADAAPKADEGNTNRQGRHQRTEQPTAEPVARRRRSRTRRSPRWKVRARQPTSISRRRRHCRCLLRRLSYRSRPRLSVTALRLPNLKRKRTRHSSLKAGLMILE